LEYLRNNKILKSLNSNGPKPPDVTGPGSASRYGGQAGPAGEARASTLQRQSPRPWHRQRCGPHRLAGGLLAARSSSRPLPETRGHAGQGHVGELLTINCSGGGASVRFLRIPMSSDTGVDTRMPRTTGSCGRVPRSGGNGAGGLVHRGEENLAGAALAA
jgi:hypothetical protein